MDDCSNLILLDDARGAFFFLCLWLACFFLSTSLPMGKEWSLPSGERVELALMARLLFSMSHGFSLLAFFLGLASLLD